ncbi:MAG TPA: family 78 glycoside hydrolase catalytic domain [Anaerohalosphaeraceae bacterium]|nr:family 78 glycoside hydrolase catalytic domain [Anaerohalosphaeraceae bacterium]HOM75717.1 family 78 glycoside hydrolase catalytic domain [Anaerohalosphaeraceae bacterium]HPC64820.1 family 78 glycoside hydrolase catalytic domain [Anaerohalosphaeraceae bacterium]HPO70199.1 family 78 glycoside hydrolase catalytic domain [Anaerohalosphaeraceae bacterium]HRS70693.1 family 78 glycoside hydrolase catalytic domain [Anaerohalosphaeraceae bacterium]
MKRIMPLIVFNVGLVVCAGCLSSLNPASHQLIPVLLRCEYRTDPIGIDIISPRFSWQLQSDQRGQKQTAYQIYVASDLQLLQNNQPDMWDSGKVQSDETAAVAYAGKPLASDSVYFWKVRLWDKDGNSSPWSLPAKWSMGLLHQEEWQAEWIGYDIDEKPIPTPDVVSRAKWVWAQPNANISAPPGTCYFRKAFQLPQDWIIQKAVCYYTADDFVQLHLNGSLLRSFRNRKVIYEVVLADYLRPGVNVLAFRAVNEGNADSPAGFWAAVRIESADGRILEFATDNEWLLSTDEQLGWKTVDYDDAGWSRAVEIGPLGITPWEQTKPMKRLLPPARYFRKDFAVSNKEIERATLYATALGIYQCSINGQRVTDDYLSPGWTDYRKRVYYRAYDVTKQLRRGSNAIGGILADGWYAGYVGGGLNRNHYGRKTRMLLQLNIQYEDGTKQIVGTAKDWKASTGPILYADLLQGEGYDARQELPGWDMPGFDESAWRPVIAGDTEVNPQIRAAVTEPVRVFSSIKPVSVAEPVRGIYVFNMGQNFAGVVRLQVHGRPGQRIQVRHAERLNPNGTIYTTNLRTASATDIYICKGSGKTEVWQPYFTQHGFQYVEITGLDEKPDLDTVTGLVLTSDTPIAGSFDCSDPMVNRLYSNIVWTQRMNFIDIPTDCPQRDERFGWTGDAQVYINTACYNNDVQSFFTKWLMDLTDAQRDDGQFPRYAPLKVDPTDGGPAWADAGVICPWTIYKMYGDKRILQTHYDAMKKFIEFNRKRCTSALLPPEKFQCFGDWLNINDETPHDVIYTAYFAHSTHLFAMIADALGKTDDAQTYGTLFEQLKSAFSNAYVGPDGTIKGDTQTAYVLAIAYDLLDPAHQKLAAEHLVRRIRECGYHLSTGFIGTKDLMLALAKIGRNDLAYRLLYNDSFPSWGFTIKQGATSIWERWNGWTPQDGFADPGMNSFAHYSFGAVGQWIFENIGGIQSQGPGFKTMMIHPQPDGKMMWAKTSYHSVRGLIVSNWEIRNGCFVLDVTIPPNTEADVFIPAQDAEKVLESGIPAQQAEGVTFLKQQAGTIVYKVKSGKYQFRSPWTP